jgi:hypothetical protein
MGSRRDTIERSAGQYEQVHLRLPADLLNEARAAAKQRGTSMTAEVVAALAERVRVPCPYCKGTGHLPPIRKNAPGSADGRAEGTTAQEVSHEQQSEP